MVITVKLVVPFPPVRRFHDPGPPLHLATNASGVESSVATAMAAVSRVNSVQKVSFS